MLAAVLAAALGSQVPAPLPNPASGDWVLIRVQRVIAPANMPGQCFVQGRVDQVIHGQTYRQGQTVGISLACRPGAGVSPVALRIGEARRAPPTIQVLREMKQALAHLDTGGRVVDNQYYGVDAASPGRP
jgi:hypothetical protein